MTGYSTHVDDIRVRLRVDMDQAAYNRALGDSVRSADSAGAKIGRGLAVGIGAGVVAMTAASIKIKGLLDEGTNLASSYTESVNKNMKVFGDAGAKSIQTWSDNAFAIGLSKTAAMEYSGTIGNLLKTAGVTRKELSGMSTDVVTMAADFASFNNTSPEQAFEAIRSGLSGESEPLRNYGVFLNDAAVNAEALAMGLVKANVDMDKVAGARLKHVEAEQEYREALKASQGDSVALQEAEVSLARARERKAAVDGSNATTDLDRKQAAIDVAEAEAKVADLQKGSSLELAKAKQKVADAENGIKKALAGSKVELTDQQKIQARWAIIDRQGGIASGDAESSLETSLARQRENVKAQRDNLLLELGQAAMPAQMEWNKTLNDEILPSLTKTLTKYKPEIQGALEGIGDTAADVAGAFADWLGSGQAERDLAMIRDRAKEIWEETGPVRDEFAQLWEDLQPLIDQGVPAFQTLAGELKDLATDAIPFLTSALEAFNNMPDWAKTAVGVGVGAIAVKKALGGGGGGSMIPGAGIAGAAADGAWAGTKTAAKAGWWLYNRNKPMPVIVMNPGALGGGLDVPGGGGKHKGGKAGRLAGLAAGTTGAVAGAAAVAGGTYMLADNLIDRKFERDQQKIVVGGQVFSDDDALNRLKQSAVAQYADELGIDMERLNESIIGEDKAYLNEVLDKLKAKNDGTGELLKGAFGNALGISTESEEATRALEDLVGIWTEVDKYHQTAKEEAEAAAAQLASLNAMDAYHAAVADTPVGKRLRNSSAGSRGNYSGDDIASQGGSRSVTHSRTVDARVQVDKVIVQSNDGDGVMRDLTKMSNRRQGAY